MAWLRILQYELNILASLWITDSCTSFLKWFFHRLERNKEYRQRTTPGTQIFLRQESEDLPWDSCWFLQGQQEPGECTLNITTIIFRIVNVCRNDMKQCAGLSRMCARELPTSKTDHSIQDSSASFQLRDKLLLDWTVIHVKSPSTSTGLDLLLKNK